MDFYKDSCCGARQLPRRLAPSSSADRGHSLSSLHPPPAALPSLPHNVRSEKEMHALVASLANGWVQ